MAREKTTRSAYDTALSYLTDRARTVREVELKLDEGNYSEGEIMQTIERLAAAGLLDDRRFAHEFVETRLNTKPVSRARLEQQLRGHHVDAPVIDAALERVTDEVELANAVAVVEKFLRQFEKLDDETRRRRIFSRLQTRGYSRDTTKLAMERCGV